MRNNLMLHCGGKAATLEDLLRVKVPEKTDTYQPLPYMDLVNMTREISIARLGGFELSTENYGLNKAGTQMFGIQRFHNPNDPGLQLAVGMRTSYDKSMSTGLAIGGSVFVCDNMAFSGQVQYLRRHTGELMLADLEEGISRAVWTATSDYGQIQFDRDRLMQVEIDQRDAHHLLMVMMFKHDVISTNQMARVYQNWEHPPHEEFEPRNLWSLYNAVNEPLKGVRGEVLFEKHIKLHQVMVAAGQDRMGSDWDAGQVVEADWSVLAERVPV